MAAVYNYSKARQNLAAVLEQAAREGEVRIRRKDGQVFAVKPEPGEQEARSKKQEARSREQKLPGTRSLLPCQWIN